MSRNLAHSRYPAGGKVVRLHILVSGTVQGVGFRPFVYLLARENDLTGWVRNSPRGVDIEVEGDAAQLEAFVGRLTSEKPVLARIEQITQQQLEPEGDQEFSIVASENSGAAMIPILPEVATCDACRRELFDVTNRRYRYPFSSCTHCGPRYSIVETLPYDRQRTAMSEFPLCERCQDEYNNPADRRFHAQATACPECGPQLELLDPRGNRLAERDEALRRAAQAIASGDVVAVKGLSGFHLMTNAMDIRAVKALRIRKHRDEKPFALMMPSLADVRKHCELSQVELNLLTSPAAPIVLLRRRPGSRIATSVAPGGNPYLGVMLPYTPMHHLLLDAIGVPVVATSANPSDEPICSENAEALERMNGIADLFLCHNRRIVNPLDDSVTRVIAGQPMLLRRARGYAPAPVVVAGRKQADALATGAHLNNTVAITVGSQCFISPHIGDLGSLASLQHFKRVLEGMQKVYDHRCEQVVCDQHPDYLSSRYADSLGLPLKRVQHHYAHALSCMVDNGIEGPVVAVCWDGTGYGGDGTVWGGEFLHIKEGGFERAAHLRTFPLPGGEAAVRESRRTAVSLLHEAFGAGFVAMNDLQPVGSFTSGDLALLVTMIDKGVNTPVTSSAGRLFDGVSSLLGLTHHSAYEGQAAMMVEYATEGHENDRVYPFSIQNGASPLVIDWRPVVTAIVEEIRAGVDPGEIASSFHNTLAAIIGRVCDLLGQKRVVLSGGCFQNRYLSERVLEMLAHEGFDVYRHREIPPNDGGIALGQIAAAMREEG